MEEIRRKIQATIEEQNRCIEAFIRMGCDRSVSSACALRAGLYIALDILDEVEGEEGDESEPPEGYWTMATVKSGGKEVHWWETTTRNGDCVDTRAEAIADAWKHYRGQA